jgi:hypothetical protein
VQNVSVCNLEISLTMSFPKALLLIAVSAVTIGCSATDTTSANSGLAKAAYSNFLVIGIAGSYDSRAHFERTAVSGLRAEGAAASAYHVVVGGNKPINRESVQAAIQSGGFDAVVVTRALDTDTDVGARSAVTGTKVTRKDGGVLNMFRYDYEEMNEPLDIQINTRVTFATELYDAASEELVWSNESESRKFDNVGLLIEDTAATVVRLLERNDFIGR